MRDASFLEGGSKPSRKTIHFGGTSTEFELPQRYDDWSMMFAHFPASTRRVRDLIPDDDLVPVELAPGRAIVTVGAYDYVKPRTLEPYKEVGICIPVRYKPKDNLPLLPLLAHEYFEVGFWIHLLPVTSPEACAAGETFWNFPKKVEKCIAFEVQGWHWRCTWGESNFKHEILTLTAPIGETTYDARTFDAYSVLNGRLLRTEIAARGQFCDWKMPGAAWLKLGEGEVADELRGLDIRTDAIGGTYARNLRGILPAGVDAWRRRKHDAKSGVEK